MELTGNRSFCICRWYVDFLLPIVSVEDCTFLTIPADHVFVALDDSIDHAMETIRLYAPLECNPLVGDKRVPPLVYRRLQRGGKTTFLIFLFDALKSAGYAPIAISFNGGFQRRRDETPLQALLRQIGLQLVDTSTIADRLNVTFDAKTIIDHISVTSNGRTVVLLIDELNALQFPIDEETSFFLKAHFLDTKDRYLVFTSHNVLDLDFWSNVSKRGCRYATVPVCKDLEVLQTMSNLCGSLTPVEVAVYGRIPSLIYFAKSDPQGPQLLLNEYFALRVKHINTMATLTNVFRKFLTGLMMASAVEVDVGESSDELVNSINAFASVDPYKKSSWPIC